MSTSLDYETSISLTPLTGYVGARVSGVDLSEHLTPPLRNAIWQALLAHKVLFFRNQTLDHARHVALGRLFGDLTRRPPPHNGVAPDGFPEILVVDSKAEDERYGEDFEERYRLRWLDYNSGWHTDLTPALNPPAASILRAEAVTSFGGDTQWVDLEAAYDHLTEPMRTLADSLHAEHAFFAGCQMLQYDQTDVEVLKLNNDHPLVSRHPVVRVHPETGARCLFVNPASTNRIAGLTPSQSRELLELFFEQIARPEFSVRWRWSPGDVVFWDNRNTAHLSPADAAISGEARTLYRVTILGDIPKGTDGAESESIAGDPFRPLPFNGVKG